MMRYMMAVSLLSVSLLHAGQIYAADSVESLTLGDFTDLIEENTGRSSSSESAGLEQRRGAGSLGDVVDSMVQKPAYITTLTLDCSVNGEESLYVIFSDESGEYRGAGAYNSDWGEIEVREIEINQSSLEGTAMIRLALENGGVEFFFLNFTESEKAAHRWYPREEKWKLEHFDSCRQSIIRETTATGDQQIAEVSWMQVVEKQTNAGSSRKASNDVLQGIGYTFTRESARVAKLDFLLEEDVEVEGRTYRAGQPYAKHTVYYPDMNFWGHYVTFMNRMIEIAEEKEVTGRGTRRYAKLDDEEEALEKGFYRDGWTDKRVKFFLRPAPIGIGATRDRVYPSGEKRMSAREFPAKLFITNDYCILEKDNSTLGNYMTWSQICDFDDPAELKRQMKVAYTHETKWIDKKNEWDRQYLYKSDNLWVSGELTCKVGEILSGCTLKADKIEVFVGD